MSEEKLSAEEEQKFMMQKITDMLVAAGYFRARMEGLDPFDKIVGGMSWGIRASGVPVDVDVAFKENANIGDKITIAENIVKALLQMKCPVRLRPHQIQGLELNCRPLFPVVQWLVKSVIDYRRVTGDRVRNYATFLFDLEYDAMPLEKTNANSAGGDFLRSVSTGYNFNRKFKKSNATSFSTNESYVDATLLEYGFKFHASSIFTQEEEKQADASGSATEEDSNRPGKLGGAAFANLRAKLEQSTGGGASKSKKKGKATRERADSMEEAKQAMENEEDEEKRLNQIEQTLQQATDLSTGDAGVSGGTLGSLLSVDQIREKAGDYAEQQTLLATDAQKIQSRQEKQLTFAKKKEKLEKRLADLEEKRQEHIATFKGIQDQKGQMDETLTQARTENERIGEAIKELEVKEQRSENRELLDQLKQLVILNETLKRQETNFKENCGEQRTKLVEKLNEVGESKGDEDDEESRRMRKIEELYAKDSEKYNRVRELLADKNQDIARVQRRLESYPTRAELLQYEKRFVELYAQTGERLKETKKYYALYNSLTSIHEHMTSEVNLYDQIREEFPNRIGGEADREGFLRSLNTMLNGLEAGIESAQNRLNEVKGDKDEKTAAHSKLLQKQRKYYALVKEFENACQVNEDLTNRQEVYARELGINLEDE